VTVWDLTSQTALARMNHELRINALGFSPDGIHLVSVSRDKTAKLWRVTTGELEADWIHESNLWELAFSPDGRYLAVAGDTCLVRVWDVQNRPKSPGSYSMTTPASSLPPSRGTVACSYGA